MAGRETLMPDQVPAIHQTVARLCRLVSRVNDGVYGHSIPTDCFCGEGGFWPLAHASDWQFDDRALDWLEATVERAIAAERRQGLHADVTQESA